MRLLHLTLITLMALVGLVFVNENTLAMSYIQYLNQLDEAIHVSESAWRKVPTDLSGFPKEPQMGSRYLQERPSISLLEAKDECLLLDRKTKYWGTVGEIIHPEDVYVDQVFLILFEGGTYEVVVERNNCWDHIQSRIISYSMIPERHVFRAHLSEEGTHEIQLSFLNGYGFVVERVVQLNALQSYQSLK